MRGDESDDLLIGQEGGDFLSGNQGNNILLGGDPISEEDDVLATVYGFYRRDIILGSIGNDVLIGARGDDALLAFGGHDILQGMEGDDTLIAIRDHFWWRRATDESMHEGARSAKCRLFAALARSAAGLALKARSNRQDQKNLRV